MSDRRCGHCGARHPTEECKRGTVKVPCRMCADLPWRRDCVGGCERCGKPFGVELPSIPEPRNASAIAEFGSW